MKKRRSTSVAREPLKPVALAVLPINTNTARQFLQEVRDKASQDRFRINRTLAELDAIRDEIDATIAFLKQQHGGNRRD